MCAFDDLRLLVCASNNFFKLNIYETFILYRSAEKQRLETQLKTLQSELTHKTDEINRLNTQVQVLTTDANEYKTSIQTLEEAMENQRSKNNVSLILYFTLFDKF